MKQILTKETKDGLMRELKRIEDFAIKSGDKKLLEIYFPHTLYEVGNIMDKAIGLEIEYGENNKLG